MENVTDTIIIKELISNNEYFLKVFPFIHEEHFSEDIPRKLFKCISGYYKKYNRVCNVSVLRTFVEKLYYNSPQIEAFQETLSYLDKDEKFDQDWIEEETLSWIQQRMYFNALLDSSEKLDKNELDATLVDKITEVFSITFDVNIGLGSEDLEERWEMYSNEDAKIPFLLSPFNAITGGGLPRKTLNMFMSSQTGGCKSLTMCHLATDYQRMGYNVLYVTLEMSEDKVFERLDANSLDKEIDDMKSMGKDAYISSMKELLSTKMKGSIKVKQFPTSMCNVGHIRHLLNELKLKKKWIPDIIIVDYLNIMSSLRMKSNEVGNTNSYIKAITEELRGLAVEQDILCWTATQSNRGGADAQDEIGLTDISESYGATFGADVILAVITSQELDQDNKILFKQLKNRYSDINKKNSFPMTVSKPKMKLYPLDQESVETYFEEEGKNEDGVLDTRKKKTYKNFSGFKFD